MTTGLFIPNNLVGYMEKEVCVLCLQGIKNPICSKCRIREIEYWLKESAIDKRIKGKILKEIRKRFNVEIISESKCIICSDEFLNLCGYCFFHEIYKILKKYNVTRNQIVPYLETFNYRFFDNNYEEINDYGDENEERYLNRYISKIKLNYE